MADRTVLIVDDEFAIRDMLRMALEIAELNCLEAENIQDAYQVIVDERPDIVLLDWMLPDGSGLDLCRRMRVRTCYMPYVSVPPENYLAAIGSTKGALVSTKLAANTDLHSVEEFRNLVIYQQDDTIDHRQNPLHFASEISMTGGINKV